MNLPIYLDITSVTLHLRMYVCMYVQLLVMLVGDTSDRQLLVVCLMLVRYSGKLGAETERTRSLFTIQHPAVYNLVPAWWLKATIVEGLTITTVHFQSKHLNASLKKNSSRRVSSPSPPTLLQKKKKSDNETRMTTVLTLGLNKSRWWINRLRTLPHLFLLLCELRLSTVLFKEMCFIKVSQCHLLETSFEL